MTTTFIPLFYTKLALHTRKVLVVDAIFNVVMDLQRKSVGALSVPVGWREEERIPFLSQPEREERLAWQREMAA